MRKPIPENVCIRQSCMIDVCTKFHTEHITKYDQIRRQCWNTWAAKIGGDMKCVPVSEPTDQTESTRTTFHDLDQEDMFNIAANRALKSETEDFFQSQTEDDTESHSSLDQQWYD